MSCDCCVAPPRCVMGLSAVCDCAISWSFSLFLLFIVTPFVEVCNCSMFCCTLLYVLSSFAIILMGNKELVVLLCLSSWCLVIVVVLFLAVPWVCLQYVIVVVPDHTHYFCTMIV